MAGAGILANGVTEILKKLSSIVANEITLVWDFEDELKNLQSTLNMILAVMEDAENKQMSDAAVRKWMGDLKSIAYDAEDILDEYAYEVILFKHKHEKKEDKSNTTLNQVRNKFSRSKPSFICSWKLAHEVKKINKKFNKTTKCMTDLRLQMSTSVGSSSSSHTLMMMNRETYSLVVDHWKIVGREKEKSTIIKMLLEEEENSSNQGSGGKHVSVIPIAGMGGLGKTTMAQLLYNDEAVQNHFPVKIWICVSHPFDIKKLYKNIVNSTRTGEKYDDAATMDDIVLGLQDALREKKFLLVLDDVWNENSDDWYKFKTPFMVGAEGSKILVTTRSVEVAELMEDKFPPYELGILNHNDSFSLFKELAFGSATTGVVETSKLVEIGKEMASGSEVVAEAVESSKLVEIGEEMASGSEVVAEAVESSKLVEIGEEMVKRCGGLPLAVIFLGSLMRSKKKENEWKIIRDTKIWHESYEEKKSKHKILPSLRLSYDHLPSNLKQCFSYCCLFPKDSIILKEKLIRLWMAEGFLIESPRENAMSMEEIGNEYFHTLLSSFFFQDVEKDDDGDIVTCKMHDLVHDLARSVVGVNECLIVESVDDIKLISEATRRLNLVNLDGGEMLPKVLEALKKATNLRTIIVNHQTIRFDIGNAFKENKRLRVLDLSDASIESTSSLIGELKHLRYLDVDEVLLPKRIARSCFLQTLCNFYVGDKKEKKNVFGGGGGGIEELECLNLTGVLLIYHLQNVTSETDACRANLKKKNLRGLNLSWGSRCVYNENDNDEAVLEGLRPHHNLRYLWIKGFDGAKLPGWIKDSSCLPNLVELTLYNVKYIEELAGLGALPSLRSLTLDTMRKLKCIGNEVYYSAVAAGSRSSSSTATTGEASTTIIAFPSLKKLTLKMMPHLKKWVVPVPAQVSTTTGATTTYCFPLLEEIELKYCSRLRTITPTTTIFPSLKVLYLDGIHGSAAETLVTNNLSSLISLTLFNIDSLLSLNISQVVSSSSCSSSSSSSSLQSLKLHYCSALKFYPDILSFTSLRKLEIRGTEEFLFLQGDITCLSSSLKHLEYVQILKKSQSFEKEKVVLEWRKSSFF